MSWSCLLVKETIEERKKCDFVRGEVVGKDESHPPKKTVISTAQSSYLFKVKLHHLIFLFVSQCSFLLFITYNSVLYLTAPSIASKSRATGGQN